MKVLWPAVAMLTMLVVMACGQNEYALTTPTPEQPVDVATSLLRLDDLEALDPGRWEVENVPHPWIADPWLAMAGSPPPPASATPSQGLETSFRSRDGEGGNIRHHTARYALGEAEPEMQLLREAQERSIAATRSPRAGIVQEVVPLVPRGDDMLATRFAFTGLELVRVIIRRGDAITLLDYLERSSTGTARVDPALLDRLVQLVDDRLAALTH